MSAAEVLAKQRMLWAASPRDWADLAEPQSEPLFGRLLDIVSVGTSTRVLDVACGSGLLCAMAATRGAAVTGIDATPELLEIARKRTPLGDFHEADMTSLPFPDGAFEVVTGVNAFQFAFEPAAAFAEAARVLVPGGRVAVAAFAEAERNESTALHLAMEALLPETGDDGQDGHAPFRLSETGGIQQALVDANLTVVDVGETRVAWRYSDVETALRALLCSAGGARTVRVVGLGRFTAALTAAIAPFAAEDGTVTMWNTFNYAVGERSA